MYKPFPLDIYIYITHYFFAVTESCYDADSTASYIYPQETKDVFDIGGFKYDYDPSADFHHLTEMTPTSTGKTIIYILLLSVTILDFITE